MDRIGRYEIVKELGRGAMGVVFLATDPTIGRSVAIKTIRLGEVTDPEERARLQQRLFREARSAGILSHPGIVTIYDMNEGGEMAYIAMEYVDGPTLEQLLSEREPIAPDRLLHLLRQTAAALDYAHQKGIVHRDIKPANIMVTSNGTAKIADFGIAKVTTSQQFTQAGTLVGTPNYMSPEQVQGLAVDGRADQFSLAVIAYEMLTGAKPFTGDHVTTVVYKIVAEEPAQPQRLNPTLGPRIGAVLRKALAKKPEARYGTCMEFAGALERACVETKDWKPLRRGGDQSLPTVAATQVAAPVGRGSTITQDTAVVKAPRSSRLPALAGALAVVLGLLVLLTLQFGGWPRLPAPPPPPEAAMARIPAPPLPELAEVKKPSPLAPATDTQQPDAAAPPATAAPESAQASPPEPQPSEPPRSQPPRRADANAFSGLSQDVWFASQPAGAKVLVDGLAERSCSTPCMLSLAPGKHSVSVTAQGFHVESRDFQVTDSPLTLPAFALRGHGGTLLLSTTPPGAAIFVNDRRESQTTPAQLSLPPGTYRIAVEKDGRRRSESVQIRNDAISHLKISLE